MISKPSTAVQGILEGIMVAPRKKAKIVIGTEKASVLLIADDCRWVMSRVSAIWKRMREAQYPRI